MLVTRWRSPIHSCQKRRVARSLNSNFPERDLPLSQALTSTFSFTKKPTFISRTRLRHGKPIKLSMAATHWDTADRIGGRGFVCDNQRHAFSSRIGQNIVCMAIATLMVGRPGHS